MLPPTRQRSVAVRNQTVAGLGVARKCRSATVDTRPGPGVGVSQNIGPSLVRCGKVRIGVRSREGKGADMSDKSPRKTASKKSGKSLKEKRQAKKDKEQAHKPLVR